MGGLLCIVLLFWMNETGCREKKNPGVWPGFCRFFDGWRMFLGHPVKIKNYLYCSYRPTHWWWFCRQWCRCYRCCFYYRYHCLFRFLMIRWQKPLFLRSGSYWYLPDQKVSGDLSHKSRNLWRRFQRGCKLYGWSFCCIPGKRSVKDQKAIVSDQIAHRSYHIDTYKLA